MKERIIEFDLIRVVACIMVITMHAPIPSIHANGLFLGGLSYLTAPCIGLFFMVSGALLLPVTEPTFVFLKKRLTKVLFPTLVWTLIYLAYNHLFTSNANTSLLKEIFSIPFCPQGNAVLWFMYVLIGLYLLAPIISQWLKIASKQELQFYLFLWGVTLCYPFLKDWINIGSGVTDPLFYFSGYAGYFILGYYLKTYIVPNKPIISLVGIAMTIPVLYLIFNWETDFYSKFWYLSILVVILCIGWFQLFKIYGNKLLGNKIIRHAIIQFSNLSFGIYLVHIMIMRNFLWKCTWIANIDSYVLQTCCVILCTLLLSHAFCWSISFIPYSQYIIGYRQKK